MNYYGTQRDITETVMLGSQPFRVQATWRIEENGEEKIDVRLFNQDGKIAATFLGLDGTTALVSFAEVFLTLDKMIGTESVDASPVIA